MQDIHLVYGVTLFLHHPTVKVELCRGYLLVYGVGGFQVNQGRSPVHGAIPVNGSGVALRHVGHTAFHHVPGYLMFLAELQVGIDIGGNIFCDIDFPIHVQGLAGFMYPCPTVSRMV